MKTIIIFSGLILLISCSGKKYKDFQAEFHKEVDRTNYFLENSAMYSNSNIYSLFHVVEGILDKEIPNLYFIAKIEDSLIIKTTELDNQFGNHYFPNKADFGNEKVSNSINKKEVLKNLQNLNEIIVRYKLMINNYISVSDRNRFEFLSLNLNWYFSEIQSANKKEMATIFKFIKQDIFKLILLVNSQFRCYSLDFRNYYNSWLPYVRLEKYSYKTGEKAIANISLISYNTNAKYEIIVKNDTIKVEKGIGRYKLNTTSKGHYKIRVDIVISNKSTKERTVYPAMIEYTVR